MISIKRGSRKLSQSGSNSDNVSFFRREGRENPISTKSGAIIDPPKEKHLNGVSLAGR